MTLTVLVPEEEGLAALAELDNVYPVVYNPAGRMPEEAGEAEIIVVPPLHADRLVAAMRDMPKLRLVQTLSAGIDQWEGRLPSGVGLSNARGAHGGATAEWAATGFAQRAWAVAASQIAAYAAGKEPPNLVCG